MTSRPEVKCEPPEEDIERRKVEARANEQIDDDQHVNDLHEKSVAQECPPKKSGFEDALIEFGL
jgi:hypothetical protein